MDATRLSREVWHCVRLLSQRVIREESALSLPARKCKAGNGERSKHRAIPVPVESGGARVGKVFDK